MFPPQDCKRSATRSVFSSNDYRAQDRAWHSVSQKGGVDGVRERATKGLEKGREDKQEREREKSISHLLVTRRNLCFQGQTKKTIKVAFLQ